MLKTRFLQYLEKAARAVNFNPSPDSSSSRPDNKKLVIILDALNQLDESYNAHSLDWLPKILPKVSKMYFALFLHQPL